MNGYTIRLVEHVDGTGWNFEVYLIPTDDVVALGFANTLGGAMNLAHNAIRRHFDDKVVGK